VYVTFAVQLDPRPLGVQVVPEIAPNVPCVGVAAIANVNAALSISVADNVMTWATFSNTVRPCALAVGTSFTGVIVTLTVPAVEVSNPSLVVNVKLSGPL
jgi:hypothetical protein